MKTQYCNATCLRDPCRKAEHNGATRFPCPHCGSPVINPLDPKGTRYEVQDCWHAAGCFCLNPKCYRYFIPTDLPADVRVAAEPWELISTDERKAEAEARPLPTMITALRRRMKEWRAGRAA